MHFYPGITNLLPLARIQRERALAKPADVLVRVGQQVTPVQVIARRREDVGVRIVDVSRQLDIPRPEVPQYLLVEEGSPVQEDQPLVQRPGRFGRAREYRAPITGTLHRIINGRIILRHSPRTSGVRAMVPGYITGIVFNRGALVETFGSLIQGRWGSGAEDVGRLQLAVTGPHEAISVSAVTMDARNSVLVGGIIDNPAVLEAATENGLRGLIAGSMPAALCRRAEALKLPVLLTDGIGRQGMATPFFELLSQSVGRETALLTDVGSERTRRPEAIIPLPADRDVEKPAGPQTALEAGKQVRLLRAPHAARVGTVVAIEHEAVLPGRTGRQPAAEVRLDSGQRVLVPLLNLELLE